MSMYKDAQFRILLVEDNPGDVRLVEIFLGESDLKDNEIVNERTLAGAIKALDETLFDVILLDFNLLDSNGFETLETLLAAHPKANVIVFTGMEDTNFGIRALQAGAQDYLVKGNFGSDYLAKTLRYAIERNRTNLRLEEAQKEAEKLREEKARAEEREQLKGELLTTVSHEMRTPMNAIMGLVDLLLKEDFGEEQLDYLSSVKSQSEHLLKMINDILELQKIQDIQLEKGAFDLHDVLMNLINIQYSSAKDVAINIEIDENVPRCIMGDEKRLNQVFINIVSNAFKFTEKGKVSIHVEMIEPVGGGKVRLGFRVEDTGIGIPEDKLPMIFEPFMRVRDGQKKYYEGIGLGLSIVKRIINLMDGDITVSSKPDVGSVFSFDVLLEQGDESLLIDIRPILSYSLEGEVPPVEHPEEPKVCTEKIPILLAEDNKMNQLVTRKQLERTGRFELTIAENGQIATEILREQEFELVLMDIQMPIMDGYEATEYIRKELKISAEVLPILAMTAHADIVDSDKFKTVGMQGCILKPVNDWPAAIAKIDSWAQKKIKKEKVEVNVMA